MLRAAGAVLGGELRAMRDWRLALLLGVVAMLLGAAAQLPVHYAIDVGQEDGPGSDLPLLRGFYTTERDDHGNFRWTTERAIVCLPGLGQRPLQLTLRVFPINAEVAARGPQILDLWANNQPVGSLAVRPTGAIYRVLLPPPLDGSGNAAIEIRSATFVPTGDVRALGSPVDAISVTSDVWAWPAWPSALGWLLAALLLWLALQGAGFSPTAALALLLPVALLLGLASALDPPRTALGARPFAVAAALGWLLTLLLRAGMPRLSALAGVPLDRRVLRWLLLMALVVFVLRFGGKLYPDAMPGDIGFHANRYAEVVGGIVLLLSRNRGVDFPYPPVLYLLIAPLSLLGINERVLLRLVGAILDATSPFLVYAIAAGRQQSAVNSQQLAVGSGWLSVFRRSSFVVRHSSHAGWPLLAAGIYAFSAAGFMTTWWNFSSHIFTQWAHLLLITALVLWWQRMDEGRRTKDDGRGRRHMLIFAVLFLLVFLGHFGFWINTSLLGAMGLALLAWMWVRSARGPQPKRELRAGGLLAISFVVAELFAVLFFYSAYTGLFIAQAQVTASSGLTGLAEREPVPFAVLWDTLWDAGFRVHFGLFPVPLALVGLLLLQLNKPPNQPATRRALWFSGASVLTLLIGGTFIIALGFAALPFLTGSSLSTRWLMFSAWAIAVAAALVADALWRRGRAGRLMVWITGSYLVWITLSQWLAALAWRVRPPEPF